ncbi:MAG: WD40 repeat domain-containing protein [Gemmatales bacterium]
MHTLLFQCLLFVLFLPLIPTLAAQDLQSIQRKLVKEPTYQSTPEYGLLVLGAKQQKVWFVRDGNILYVDRFGTGDLTRPEARVLANVKESSPSEFEYQFDVGSLPGLPGEPTDVIVMTRRLSAVPDLTNEMKQKVIREPNVVSYMIVLQTKHPAWKGMGVDRRLMHVIGYFDHRGALHFSSKAETAPIFHVGGPLQIVPFGQLPTGRAGSSCEIVTAVGTPGLGSGSTAFLAYEMTILPGLTPTLEVTYATGEKATTPLKQVAPLKERCCGVNFYGRLHIPAEAGVGLAHVRISLTGWSEAVISPSEATMNVLPQRVKIIPQSISLQPSRQLVHPDRQGSMYQLQFSPDASKFFASSLSGGILQWWDLASGQQLRSIETGTTERRNPNYAMLSPDWKSVWVGDDKRPQIKRLEKEGKQYVEWKYDSRLRHWDATTGALQESILKAGRNYCLTTISQDGRYLAALEDVSGVYSRGQARVQIITLRDLKTGKEIMLPSKYGFFHDFSHDGKHLLVCEADGKREKPLVAWHLISVPEGTVKHSLTAEQCIKGHMVQLSKDTRYAYSQVTTYAAPRNYQKYTSELQCWDFETGKKVETIPVGDERQRYSTSFNDNHTMLMTCSSPDPRHYTHEPSTVRLYQLPEMKLKHTIPLHSTGSYGAAAFHPLGKLTVQVCQQFPKELYNNAEFATLDVEEIPQPSLCWIDLAKGKVIRTDILPPAIVGRLQFSPDGKTLAMGVRGGVSLFDVPGELLK